MRKREAGLLVSLLVLMGCESGPVNPDDPELLDDKKLRNKDRGKLFGDNFLSFGGPTQKNAEAAGITVNEFLWRASLDTVSFMPLRTVDPFGGVILTEWYTPENAKNERIKVDVFILDRQLRSNGIRVAMHKQVYNTNSKSWIDQKVDPKTINDFEEAILTRARQLKVNSKH